MARLQILELPEGAGDERPPFVLVVDQYEPQRYILGPDQPEPVDQFAGIAERIGARAVLVFEETIDIPANDASAYLPHEPGNEINLKLGDQDVRAAHDKATNGEQTQR
ncbi:hypothetical protein [Streptomyces azureus]|uniref:Uncharacterized protein n=1 Tax=Streptomyces azureus TaxID=146537 RepID=A0A0K8PG64_STRAJ|nr:hypothetical protein [Streptomyces azureus]GAP46881.1 uncharacterized protein SAZU_1618 [Streptomyces azureus]